MKRTSVNIKLTQAEADTLHELARRRENTVHDLVKWWIWKAAVEAGLEYPL